MSINEQKDMPLLEHVGELRKHLIRIIISVLIGGIVVFIFIKEATNFLLSPTTNDFYSIRKINQFFSNLGLEDAQFLYSENFVIQQRQLAESFNLSIQIAIYGGILIAFPYIIYEIWKFIAPALKPNEKKNSTFYILFTILFFFLGALFGYFIITPIAIQFFINYDISDLIKKEIDISSIIKMVLSSTLGMAIVFLQPVFAYALTKAEILTPSFLKENRKYAFVIILVIAAFITPSDIISMFVAAIPLWLLYEFSIVISTVAHKRNIQQLS